MSDSNAKLERSGTGEGTGASGVADGDEIDLALEGLGEAEPTPSLVMEVDRALGALDPVPTSALPLPAPSAAQAEHDIDVALEALGEEPAPSLVMEVDRALGALEPVPSVVMSVPAAAVRAPEAGDTADLALDALGEAPAPSVGVERPEAIAAPAPEDTAELALDALGEEPVTADSPLETPDATAAEPSPEVFETSAESVVAAEPVIASSGPGTLGAEDMGEAQQIRQLSVGQGGGLLPTPELLRSLVPGMVRAAAAILGPTDPDLDDVVQQSLIGFVQALPAFRGECGPARFASRIVARTACAARRRRALQASRRVDEVDVDALEGLSPSQPAELLAERRRGILRELLADIPEEQAETLSLRVVFGFSLEEVAETTGVPVNTVRSRVRLAKEALRSRIDARPALRELLEVES